MVNCKQINLLLLEIPFLFFSSIYSSAKPPFCTLLMNQSSASFISDGRSSATIFPSTDLLTFVMNQITQQQILISLFHDECTFDLVSIKMVVCLTVWHLTSWQLEWFSLPRLLRIFQCQSLPKLHCHFSNSLDHTTINHSVLNRELTFLEIENHTDSPLF